MICRIFFSNQPFSPYLRSLFFPWATPGQRSRTRRSMAWTASSEPYRIHKPERRRQDDDGRDPGGARPDYIPAVPVKNVSHIAIGVRDLDRSLPFWTDVVGLHVNLDTEEEFTIEGEVVRRRAVYLREREGPDEPFVVLDEQLTGTAGGASGAPKRLFEVGVHHVGFWVDDIDAIAERARGAGIAIVAESGQRGADTAGYGEPPGGFVRALFVRDPDGNVVQFDQRAG